MVVDGNVIQAEDTIVISCVKLLQVPIRKDISYRFNVLRGPENCQQQLKISMDAEHAKCCICLNICCDVVTLAPCFHNFCNRCFSEWLKRSQEKCSSVLCPQC
ncbi:unnamed protein product [Malus baccata var. baccata]